MRCLAEAGGDDAAKGPAVDPEVLKKAIADGKAVYATCAACHQPTGMGMAPVFPPLAGSNWVNSLSNEELAKLTLYGLQGEITVNNQKFSGMMPGQGMMLDDQKIADVLTFVKNSWENSGGYVSAGEVKAVRDANAGQAMLKQTDFKTLK